MPLNNQCALNSVLCGSRLVYMHQKHGALWFNFHGIIFNFQAACYSCINEDMVIMPHTILCSCMYKFGL